MTAWPTPRLWGGIPIPGTGWLCPTSHGCPGRKRYRHTASSPARDYSSGPACSRNRRSAAPEAFSRSPYKGPWTAIARNRTGMMVAAVA
jgi:hypothetical protein